MKRLLILDDEPHVTAALERSLRRAFRDEPIRVEVHNDPEAALARVEEMMFDVVLSDYRMPGMNGVEFLRRVRDMQPDSMRLFLSASTDFGVLLSAINDAEAFRFVAKPWDDQELVAAIRLGLARRAELIAERNASDQVRVKAGTMTPQQREARRLEEQEPGITQVRWGPNGAVMLE